MGDLVGPPSGRLESKTEEPVVGDHPQVAAAVHHQGTADAAHPATNDGQMQGAGRKLGGGVAQDPGPGLQILGGMQWLRGTNRASGAGPAHRPHVVVLQGEVGSQGDGGISQPGALTRTRSSSTRVVSPAAMVMSRSSPLKSSSPAKS